MSGRVLEFSRDGYGSPERRKAAMSNTIEVLRKIAKGPGEDGFWSSAQRRAATMGAIEDLQRIAKGTGDEANAARRMLAAIDQDDDEVSAVHQLPKKTTE